MKKQEFYQDFTLGILGGGQLGRMIIQSAIDYNIDLSILDPDPDAPCKNLVKNFEVGSLKDYDTVYNFGKKCNLITIEIENVNTEALAQLEKESVTIFPQPHIIKLIQDKREQKKFYEEHGIPTAPFILVENKQQVFEQKDYLPAVNKLGKEGYDGRGVQVLKSENDFENAFDAPGLLEEYIPFEKELAVIVSRNEKGEIASFPTVELSFHPTANLVEFLFSPAEIDSKTDDNAQDLARKVISSLNMVGLLAVEMFLTKDGELLVNEIAPRPHNSGHHTIEANVTSQFEQHLRAILNLPLGDTSAVRPAAMLNILGEDGYTGMAEYEGIKDIMKSPGVHIHLYGKKLTNPFRKMGHITVTGNELNDVLKTARSLQNRLKVTSRQG